MPGDTVGVGPADAPTPNEAPPVAETPGAPFRSVACTHVGLVRKRNEDSFLNRPDIGLWAVADGMGGMSAGDVASRALVMALNGIETAPDPAALMREVQRRIRIVNAELRDLGSQPGKPATMGTTVAGLVVHGDHFACFWAGDSRVYRHRTGELDRLTRDHSLVQAMVDAGVLQPDEAERHPHANVIQRAVGVDDELALDCVHAAVAPGDIFLLCSDGLTRLVSDQELEEQLTKAPIEATSETLLGLVLARGAKDNVTIILVEVTP